MARRGAAWTASALITLFGAVTNSALTIQVLAASRSIKWEPESEWELSGDKWQLTGVKIIWALLSLYFASAAAVCAIGFHGVLKHKPSHVRFYRDYSIADFSFFAFFTVLATYGAFLSPARAGVCEEFSHHPELMRDMLDIGLNLENCELWLERAVFAGLAFMFVAIIIRLHFLLAVSNYYSHLVSKQYYRHGHHHQRLASSSPSPCSTSSPYSPSPKDSMTSLLPSNPTTPSSATNGHAMKRIYVLPTSSIANSTLNGSLDQDLENGVEMVYAPVPKHTLPKELQEQATEAWVSASSTAAAATGGARRHHCHGGHSHSHSYSRSHRRRSESRETTGRIKLDIGPDEGLLPAYVDLKTKV